MLLPSHRASLDRLIAAAATIPPAGPADLGFAAYGADKAARAKPGDPRTAAEILEGVFREVDRALGIEPPRR